MSKDEKFIIGGFLFAGIVGYLFIRKTPKMETPVKNNQEHLNSLHPYYRQRFIDFYNELLKQGYKVQINSSYRDFAKQSLLYKQDNRNAKPGFSPHNYGMAFDIQLEKNGKAYHMNTPQKDWLLSGVPSLADKFGLAWGGIFKGYQDKVHFYVKGIDTTKLYNLALNQFKTSDPNKIIGNRLKVA